MFIILKAVSTFIFSSIGSLLINLTTNYELHQTSTASIGATVTKLAIFNLMNSFVIAIIAVEAATRDDGVSVWCALQSPHPPGVRLHLVNE